MMQENAHAAGNQVSFTQTVKPGTSVRRQGMDFTRGQELLPAGVALTPAMLNQAASANQASHGVTRRPKLAILATGDELVPPGTALGADQIVASNSYGLVPLLGSFCDKVVDLGIVPDDKKALEHALLGAFDYGADIVVTTGGASVGERDYVREVLIDLGVQLDFWKLRMRPGKPLMFGTRGKTLIFGLPGNPVSAMVTATVILRPALRQMTGHTDPFWPRLALPLGSALPPGGDRRHFVRGMLHSGEFGALQVTPISETDSSHSSSLAMADVLIIQPEGDPGMGAGDIVQVIPLSWA
jgi:molybdopterin molybdotransferase